MPEGPEIRRSADVLGEVLNQQTLVDVEIGLCSIKQYHKDIYKKTVKRVTSWGKAMLIQLENDLTIYSHNQLYGVWHVARRGELPVTQRSLRLGLHTEMHSAVLYSASDISVWPTGRIKQQPLLSKLGPDILNETLTPESIATRLFSTRFRRRRLGNLFLDQHFLAGIGNYLRSEILFFAGLMPEQRPVGLSDAASFRLAQASIDVSHRSYKTGGYTVPLELWQKALAANAGYEQSRFMVFDRDGKPCRACSTPIERMTYSGRRLYYCPNCQKK